MVSFDTNVVLRLLVKDDSDQQQRAVDRLKKLQEQGDSVLITQVVLAETSWVLESGYDYSRTNISAALGALINALPFFVPKRKAVQMALNNYETGPADFADYLILAQSQALEATPLFTFDKKLQKHPLCEAP